MPSSEQEANTINGETTEPVGTAAARPRAAVTRRLAGATLNYGVGQVMSQVVGFLLIPVYTAYLSPEDYGIVDLAVTFGATLAIVMRLGLPGSVSRYYFDYYEDGGELRDYVTTVVISVFVMSVMIGLVTLLSMPYLLTSALAGLEPLHVILVVIGAALASLSDIQRRLIQAREQSAYSAKLSVSFVLVGVGLALLLVVALRQGATGMILSQTLCNLVFLLQAMFYLRNDISWRFRREFFTASLTYGVGVLPSHIIVSVMALGTRSLLAGYETVTAVGLWALANKFAQPIAVASTAFNAAYQPVYFSVRKSGGVQGDRDLAALICNIWWAGVGLTLAVSLAAPLMIRLVTPAQYHGAAPLVPIVGLSLLLLSAYQIFFAEVFFQKKKAWFFLPWATAGPVTVGGAWALVGPFGVYGVAWATAVGSGVAALTAAVLSRRLVRLPLDWPSLLRVTALGTAAWVAASFMPGGGVTTETCRGIVGGVFYLGGLWLSGDPITRRHVSLLVSRRLPNTPHRDGGL